MHKLSLLLLPEFSNLGLAATTEPLFVANWLAQKRLFQWLTVSADGAAVRASNGSTVTVDGDLALAQGCDSVFVLASFEPARTMHERTLIRSLRRLARAGVELGGIENGSLVLAQAGLLDEHPAAVHWDNQAGFQELFPRIRMASGPYSFSRNRLTCAGGAAVLDMMIAWIARRADAGTAEEVARHLLLRRMNPGTQRASEQDRVITRARAIMQGAIDDPLACADIARGVNLSLRQLERRFKQRLGRTVHSEYLLMRVQKAHQYLQQTSLAVSEVAALTGFSSVEYFSRVYRRSFGLVPSADRRQSTDAPVFRMRP